jgi:ferric-dicitrate binding protein FerR (iron transport regulator)
MSDADDERILRENLRVPALSPEAMARIRRATEAEWRAQVGRPARRWMPFAAAAAVVLLVVAASAPFLLKNGGATSEVFATLARSEGTGVARVNSWWKDDTLAPGANVRGGNDYQAHGASLLALVGGGNVRVAAGTQFKVLSENALLLERGEIYVDIPPGQHLGPKFVAITGAGEFRHVGTQFSLAVTDGATRLRVREGRVQWRAADGESTVPAGTEVRIDGAQVVRTSIDSAGEHWAWTETLAPEIDIENRPLGEFLDWCARETGRQLVIADQGTRQQVDSIRMHGSVRGLTPLQALKAVMSSTSLRFDLPAGVIRVSFAGEPPTPTA